MWLHTPRSSALAAGKGTHVVQSLRTDVQGNARPCTMLSERDMHSSFHCIQPFCSPFRCSWWVGCTQNKATTRKPGILCGSPVAWNCLPLDIRSALIYIINVQKHAQDTSFLTFLLYWLTASSVGLRAANIVRRPRGDSNHVTAPYKLSFYYYYLLVSCSMTFTHLQDDVSFFDRSWSLGNTKQVRSP